MKHLNNEIMEQMHYHPSTGIIPQINLHVSVDCFYNNSKGWGGMVSSKTVIPKKEVSQIQRYLLNWLAEQYEAKLLGRLNILIWCEKYGKPEEKVFSIDEIKIHPDGWELIDHY